MLAWINIKKNNYDYFLEYKKENNNMQPLEAAYYTIDYICENYPSPYTLMLSGGVDSQALLWAWHNSGKDYFTYSGVYNNGFNENDLCTLREFCSTNNISVNFVDFDLLRFLKEEHLLYVEKYRCGSPHMTTFMKMSEMITEGTVIMAGNFWNYWSPEVNIIDKNNFALYRYAEITKRSMVPFFFCETQELAFSFKYETNLPTEEYLATLNSIVYRDHTANSLAYAKKVKLYQDYGFPVIRQEKKLTGFELVKDYYDKNYAHLVTVSDKLSRIQGRQRSYRVFDLLLRNKYELKFLKDKYVSTLRS